MISAHSRITRTGQRLGMSRTWMIVSLLIALVVGLTAALTWNDKLARVLGRSSEAATEPSAEMDPSRSPGKKQLWTCGMHPQVIRDQPGNCPICHMKLVPLAVSSAGSGASGSSAQAAPDIRYYWDPSSTPPYVSSSPGKSPDGNDLIPVYGVEVAAGSTLTIDPVVVQNMGVRVAAAAVVPLRRTMRANGTLMEPEPNHRDVNLRVSGWIEQLFANVDGMRVEKGDPLFELYSPDLQIAIEELIAARRARDSTGADRQSVVAKAGETAFLAAHKRLELLGFDSAEVDSLAAGEHAPHTVIFRSPMKGHVTQSTVYAGGAVKAGDRVMRIADQSTMWIEIQLSQQQLALVHPGASVSATTDALPGRVFKGEVVFVHPHLDMTTRSATARTVVQNVGHELRENMFAEVEITAEVSPNTLAVPREAIIDSGERQVAFVARGGGHFEPRTVKIGSSGDGGLVEVLSGLSPGELVVTSGQFLLDSESRLREAIQKHLDTSLLAPGAAERKPPSESGR